MCLPCCIKTWVWAKLRIDGFVKSARLSLVARQFHQCQTVYGRRNEIAKLHTAILRRYKSSYNKKLGSFHRLNESVSIIFDAQWQLDANYLDIKLDLQHTLACRGSVERDRCNKRKHVQYTIGFKPRKNNELYALSRKRLQCVSVAVQTNNRFQILFPRGISAVYLSIAASIPRILFN